jgi:hypothetical protein
MNRALATVAFLLVVGFLAVFALEHVVPTEAPPPASSRSPAPTRVSATSSRAITLTFTDIDLTNAARKLMPMTVSGITVTDPVVRLQPGLLTLTATGHALLLSGPVVVTATPVVTDGKAGAQVQSATLAGIGLPDSTKADIADTFARTLAANIPSGVTVNSVTIGTGTLVIVATPE